MESLFKKQPKGFATRAIHYGKQIEKYHSSIIPPIFQGIHFKHDTPDKYPEFSYGRNGNPTRNILEARLAGLDGGKYGLCFSSGLGAISSLLSLICAGDHIIVNEKIHPDTYQLFVDLATHQGIKFDFVDLTVLDNIKNVIKPNTKMIWIETPTSTTLEIIDIKAICDFVHTACPGLLVIVDNTMLTAYFQRPLELGADIVMYSLSKYVNGHSDIIMGAIVTNSEDLITRLRSIQHTLGVIPSPIDCFQVARSLLSLKVRMEQHSFNSIRVAKFLESHRFVENVLHPGLATHSQHQIAIKQAYGHSGLLSFYIKGNIDVAKRFIKALKIFVLTTSYGGTESIVHLPYSMSYGHMKAEKKALFGVTENLIQLAVGLEDVDDLIEDLDLALNYSQMK